MKENADKYLDHLAKKVFDKATIESPSFDFTNTVMSQVNALSERKLTAYTPLISKTSWFLISIGFLALIGYLFFGIETESTGWFSTLDFSVLSNNKMTNVLSGLAISKTFMYAIVFLGLMLCVQIPLLKHNFDKQFEV